MSLSHTSQYPERWAAIEAGLDVAVAAWEGPTRDLLFFSAGAVRLYGRPGQTAKWPCVRREGLPLEVVEQAARLQGEWQAEERRWTADGRSFNAGCLVRWVASPDGGVFVETSRDLSTEQRAETLLRESEARLRQLVDATTDGLLLFDETGRLQFANEAAGRLLGWSEVPLGCRASDLELAGPGVGCPVERVLRTWEPGVAETANGKLRVTARACPGTGIVVGLRDMLSLTEATRAERDWLSGLSRRLLQAQEEERRALGRELHDEVGQLLTALRQRLRDGQVAEAEQVVDRLIGEVRGLSLDLRPALLDDLGLLSALLWLCDRTREQSGIEVALSHRGIRDRFPADVETAAYRICQEALTNVARHSGARTAALRAAASGGWLQLVVSDPGRGFDPSASPSGAGLSGMSERARLLGGTFTVHSEAGSGTRVTAGLPLLHQQEEVS